MTAPDELNERLVVRACANDLPGVQDALRRGAVANYHQKCGAEYSPLFWAAWHGNIEMIKLLLEHGADKAGVAGWDWTAEKAAERGGNPHAADYIRNYKPEAQLVRQPQSPPLTSITLRRAFGDTGREIVEVYDFERRERQTGFYNLTTKTFEGSPRIESFNRVADKAAIKDALDQLNAKGAKIDENIIFADPRNKKDFPKTGV